MNTFLHPLDLARLAMASRMHRNPPPRIRKRPSRDRVLPRSCLLFDGAQLQSSDLLCGCDPANPKHTYIPTCARCPC